ncbi:ribose 5-phosphate isomerase B [Arcicella aurantiaca]|uniref:Ribose 5-phosphate isomerase B n=1 Tax=Arcicella aurantiaca TaxID=591202 RepID=A0A316E9X4_9BACT|nr:ribose 5-phosphate isomerase B [Arcicella aurantiaca]PWK26789.1 ribose 5-phosphate isomerase B [Arcicella aurantiaca]
MDLSKKIAIGGDHAGFEYKAELIKVLTAEGYEVKDFGPYSNASCDYADFAHPLASAVENQEFRCGILLCGSANGVAMTANKHQKIRAGLAWNVEVASLVRLHNDANVLCIPARFVTLEEAIEIMNVFLETDFEGGRHQLRIDKMPC